MGGLSLERIFTAPNMTYTRTADNKVLTGQENIAMGKGFSNVLSGQVPSASEQSVLLGGGKAKNVSKELQKSRLKKAVADEIIIPGKTPVIK